MVRCADPVGFRWVDKEMRTTWCGAVGVAALLAWRVGGVELVV